MDGTDVPSSFVPLNKALLAGEVKASHLPVKTGSEIPEKSDLLAESDRVQFTQETSSTESSFPYQLTNNPDINQYIEMMRHGDTLEKSDVNYFASDFPISDSPSSSDMNIDYRV